MITYTWKFSPLTVRDEGSLTNVVKSAPWSLIAEDSHGTASISRIAYLGSADSSSYVTFDSVTTDNVKAWILSYENKTEAELKTEVKNLLVYSTNAVKVPSGWST
jgi:hypothetical protein